MGSAYGIRMMVLGALGVAVSSYGVHVKRQKLVLQNKYSALCDLEAFSCSQVLTSEYSSLLAYWGVVEKRSMLDVSNAHLGVLAYYILAFVLRDFCFVCVPTYVITGGLLWNSLALVRANQARSPAAKVEKNE